MYDENSFKNYIFWIKVKRGFFMLIFSILGAFVGIGISEFVVNVLLFDSVFRIVVIAISTLLFFSISLLVTANTGKEIQDGYWKIAVLRKLTVISKKLDNITVNPIELKEISETLDQAIKESLNEDDNLINSSQIVDVSPTPQKKRGRKKKIEILSDEDVL